MRGRIIFGVLIGIALINAAPLIYFAFSRLTGTHVSTMIETTGETTIYISGPDAPKPDWFKTPKGAILNSAHAFKANSMRSESGGVDLMTFANPRRILDDIEMDLESAGFTIITSSVADSSDVTMMVLGLSGGLYAYDYDNAQMAQVTVFRPWGLIIRPRSVQIEWMKNAPEPLPMAATGV